MKINQEKKIVIEEFETITGNAVKPMTIRFDTKGYIHFSKDLLESIGQDKWFLFVKAIDGSIYMRGCTIEEASFFINEHIGKSSSSNRYLCKKMRELLSKSEKPPTSFTCNRVEAENGTYWYIHPHRP